MSLSSDIYRQVILPVSHNGPALYVAHSHVITQASYRQVLPCAQGLLRHGLNRAVALNKRTGIFDTAHSINLLSNPHNKAKQGHT